jgi:hypothetical protein
MKRLLIAVMLVLSTACQAERQAPVRHSPPDTEARPASGENRASLGQVQGVIRKTTEVVGSIKDYGKPRQVHRRQKPELIIRGSAITFNGNQLKLGSSIVEWEKALGKSSRLKEGGSDINTWDEFGIITYRLPRDSIVVAAVIFLNRAPTDSILDNEEHIDPDGKAYSLGPDFRPNQTFPGYLELDGAGIDSQTKVWEINALAKRDRKFRCNTSLNRCHAATEDERYSLAFATDEKKDEGTIYTLTIGE